MRTEDEIKKEIEKLEELTPRIRQYTAFGDDNRAKIKAEIRVLEENLDEDAIWDMEDLIPEAVLDSMMFARQWLDGYDDDGSLSENWEPLAK